jgi:hypothetical protein
MDYRSSSDNRSRSPARSNRAPILSPSSRLRSPIRSDDLLPVPTPIISLAEKNRRILSRSPPRSPIPLPKKEAIPLPKKEAIPLPKKEAIPLPKKEAIPLTKKESIPLLDKDTSRFDIRYDVNNDNIIKSPSIPKSPTRSPSIPKSPTRSISKESNDIIPKSPTKSISKESNDINTKKIRELVLREWQIDWHIKAHKILLSNHFYIDTSPMRSGKTFIALKLAKDFDLEIMVICPLTTKNYWKNMATSHGIKLFTDPVTYESLVRGTKNEIVQKYITKKKNKTHTFFEATEEYINVLKNKKVLLILDEAQMIKNDNMQHKACNALIQPIIAGGGRSRFGILSGTLIDKPEQIINLLKIIGYIRAHRLYTTIKGNKTLHLEGVQELIDVCSQINPIAVKKFLAKTPVPAIESDKKTKDEIDNFCLSLYVEIIKHRVAGAMSAPTTAQGELYVRNGFFHILPEKANQLKDALEELQFSSGYKSKKKKSRSSEEDLDEPVKSKNPVAGNYIKSLVQIEKSKLLDMARVAKKILLSDPTNKVIITINYTGPETGNLEELLSYLPEYDPLIITGKTVLDKRDTIIEDFNTNPNKRVLIANPKPISVGISLVGDGQRYMLVSPSAKLMEIVQLSARVYGDQLMTDSYVYIFYGITGGNLEANILQFMGTKKLKSNKLDTDIKTILEKKSDVLGRMQEDEIRKNMKLPSDYEDEYEDEDDVFY